MIFKMCVYFEYKLDTSKRYYWQVALGCGDSSRVGISFPMPTSYFGMRSTRWEKKIDSAYLMKIQQTLIR